MNHPPDDASKLPSPIPLSSTSTTFPMTSNEDTQLPKVGQQRCYWALLSSDLHFIYLDPVLQYHLEEQAGSLVGKSLLSFVHPDEQKTAENDLGGVLRQNSLHGSITRVRFSRLSRVRRKLGFTGPYVLPFASAEKVTLDEHYMAVDIVINWAADGLVLCFIHATVDIDPVNDNNHIVRSPWTNWCGTPIMTQEQLQILSGRLLVCVPQYSHGRMFQILSNTSGRPLLMSWPPEDPESLYPKLAALANKIDFSQGPNGECSNDCTNPDAKTNCTRRFFGTGEVQGIGAESIYIPHGSVIFACHKLRSSPSQSPSFIRKASSSSTTSIPVTSSATMGYNTSSSYSHPPSHQSNQSSFYDQQHYSLPPLQSSTTLPPPSGYSYMASQHAQYSSYPHSSNAWNSQPATHPSVQNLRGSYWGHGSNYDGQGAPSPLSVNGGAQDNYRPLSPGYSSYSPTTPSSAGPGNDHLNDDNSSPVSGSPPSADVVPPPRRRVSPGSREYARGEGNGSGAGREGRSHGNRPAGVLRCSSCKATTSPEWRKGPSGKKELCNACGLRYARSRAKKEGHVPSSGSRKRKDKILKPAVRDSATPPTSVSSNASSVGPSPTGYSASVASYQPSSTSSYGSASLRRSGASSYDEASFSSGSGSDIYTHRGSLGTPSPSPPAGGVSTAFTHYPSSHHSEHGGHHGAAGRASYYTSSVPSPLASVPPTTLASQTYDDGREASSGRREALPPTPVSVDSRSYYETTVRDSRNTDYPRYDTLDRREERGYERDYERDYEREANRGRGIVSG
ncbi:gata transcription [Moniliophthora roreri MCA 2997]|uniref:Gata transcription n=1 Tax=Moniliophthora roreri (strain MCA 2997) TaxID=1381753 RepID=V2X946_MONRO|nr:gata transcription [Moniliophthora roreri MCA 2997]